MAAAVPGGDWFGCPDGFAAPARPAQPEIDNVPTTRRHRARRPVRPAPAINFPAGSQVSLLPEAWECSDSPRNPRMIGSDTIGKIVRQRTWQELLFLGTGKGQVWEPVPDAGAKGMEIHRSTVD